MIQNDLVVKHIPLVKSNANRINAPHMKDDLVGEGMIALVKCANKYDPNRGVTFGSYAQHRIRGAMLHYLKTNSDGPVSLDDRDSNGVPYSDVIGSDGQADRIAFRDALKYHLHPVEEWVVTKRYFEKTRMDDIALELGFKVSRVSQIHSNAIRKLRRAFSATEDKPREEGGDTKSDLLQVVRKMMWDDRGVEVCE